MKFMKPLIQGFLHDFSFPVSFLQQVELQLQGHLLQSVVLLTEEHPLRHWLVKLQGGRHFSDGWMAFCVHHHLQVGDFLVFTHQTHFVFQVIVYDPLTACQRRFCSSNPHLKMDAEAATPVPFEQPRCHSCHVTITASCIRNCVMYLPQHFIRSSGLANRRCFINLIDEKEKLWKVRLSRKSNGQAYICRGWKQFVTAHNFRHGTVVDFQLIETGRIPTFKCSLVAFPLRRSLHSNYAHSY
ncbi:hypothetical protein vseg_014084 [Gypsophila vaccaria]